MGTVTLPAPWLDLCLHRNSYTSLCFCNGTSVLMNCSAAIYPLITPMTHIKVTIFQKNKHKQIWHHLNCFYSETRSVLWLFRVATLEATPCAWCWGLPELGGLGPIEGLLAPGWGGRVIATGLQPAWGWGPLSTLGFWGRWTLSTAQDRAVPVHSGSWVFLGHVHLLMFLLRHCLCLSCKHLNVS